MKKTLFIFWVISLQVAFGQFVESPFIRSVKECFAEFGVTEAEVLSYFHSDLTVTENVPKLNQISYCAHQKAHLLNADNTQNSQNLERYLVDRFFDATGLHVDHPKETAHRAIDHCKNIQGYDVGDRIIKNYNCIVRFIRYEASPMMYYFMLNVN